MILIQQWRINWRVIRNLRPLLLFDKQIWYYIHQWPETRYRFFFLHKSCFLLCVSQRDEMWFCERAFKTRPPSTGGQYPKAFLELNQSLCFCSTHLKMVKMTRFELVVSSSPSLRISHAILHPVNKIPHGAASPSRRVWAVAYHRVPDGDTSVLAQIGRDGETRTHKVIMTLGSKPSWLPVTFLHPENKLAPADGTAPPPRASKTPVLLLYEAGINWWCRWESNPHTFA